jgi:cytochrome P450
VAALRPRVQALADGLIDAVVERGSMDLIGAFAFPLPTSVILEMLGVPVADRDRFRAWSNALITMPLWMK